MFPVIALIFAYAIAFFMSMIIIWIMSFFYEKREDCEVREVYVNPYRLVPRAETEEYKRYERRQYLDSLRS